MVYYPGGEKMGDHFIRLVETIADNKFVLGDRLVEVGFSGPRLEAALSSIAIAQGELGHARTLYSWVSGLRGKKGDPTIVKQSGKAFRFLTRIDQWISLISGLYTATTAHDIVLRAMMEARPHETASRIHKLIEEQKEHLSYAKEWIQHLLEEEGSIPKRLKECISEFYQETYAWLEFIETQTDLIEKGYLSVNEKLTVQFQRIFEDQNLLGGITLAQ
jgi:1,2-phenylacetyl-CoA epoxidase catalytic subunit